MNVLPLNLPSLNDNSPSPYWNGQTFIVGEEEHKILEYSENFQGWNDELNHFADDHAGSHHMMAVASRRNTIAEIKKHSTVQNPLILEVGCSSGFMLKEFRNAFPNATLMGADIVRAPLLKLAKDLPNVPLFRFDLTTCPLPDNSIDVVVLLNILEHIQDDIGALQQVHRILKPGGIAIIEVPASPDLFDFYDKLLLHFRRYSLKQLTDVVKDMDFSIIKKSHLGCFIYPAFWFIKKRNKWLSNFKSEEQQKKAVEKSIQNTRNSYLLNSLMNLELFFGQSIHYPFGVRCLLTVRKK